MIKVEYHCPANDVAKRWQRPACFAEYAAMPSQTLGVVFGRHDFRLIHHLAFQSKYAMTRHISSARRIVSSLQRSARAFDLTHSTRMPCAQVSAVATNRELHSLVLISSAVMVSEDGCPSARPANQIQDISRLPSDSSSSS